MRITHEDDPEVITLNAPTGATGFGSAVASVSSYENDGDDQQCSQLAIGAPGETVGAKASAGAVYLYAWDRDAGLVLRARYAPGVIGVPGAAQAGARFGAPLATGLHDDSFAEPTRLYVGSPAQDVGTTVAAGTVTSFTVGATSVTAQNARSVSQATAGVPRSPVRNGGFGSALSAEGTVVAIGAPGQTVSGAVGAGAVVLVNDAPADRVGGFAPREITQNSPGVAGTAEAQDHFGAAVHLAWDPAPAAYHLAIGAPGEDVGSAADAGTVDVLRFPFDTPTRWSAVGYDQNSAGVAGTAERGDAFGTAVTAFAQPSGELITLVGSPGEDVGSVRDAGMVQAVGTSTNPSWTQSSAGIPGAPETGDRMAATLSDRLAGAGPLVGMPGEDGGLEAVLSGLPQITGTVKFWTAATRTSGAHFGSAVAP